MTHRAWPMVQAPLAPAGLALAWSDPLTDASGALTAGNTGAGFYLMPRDWATNQFLVWAGVVGYVTGALDWSLAWEPLTDDPAPVLTPLADGRLQLRIDIDGTFFPGGSPLFPGVFCTGLATITATIDGVPCLNAIELSANKGNYTTIAWGQVDPRAPPLPPGLAGPFGQADGAEPQAPSPTGS